MSDAQRRLIEEALYAQVAEEIGAGVRREGLWAKAVAECGGSAELARARYIRLRVQSLFDEAELQRIAEAEEKHRMEVQAKREAQDQIEKRIEELRQQETQAKTIPIWVLGIFLVVVIVIVGRAFSR